MREIAARTAAVSASARPVFDRTSRWMSPIGSCSSGVYICTKSADSSGRCFTCLATPTISSVTGWSFGESTGFTDTCRPIGLRGARLLRKRLIDNQHPRAAHDVARIEGAAGHDRQFERRKIRRADDLIRRRRLARFVQRRVADHLVVRTGIRRRPIRRAAIRRTIQHRPRRAPPALPPPPGRRTVAASTAADRRCPTDQPASSTHSRPDSRDRTIAPRSTFAAAGRRRTAATPPSRLRPPPAGCATRPPPPVVVRLSAPIASVRRHRRGLEGRGNAKHHANQQRRRAAECDDAHVEGERDGGGKQTLGNQHRRHLQNGGADGNAERAADDRQHHAFGEQLPDDAPAAGAERRAHGELARSRGGARQQAGSRRWRSRSTARTRRRRGTASRWSSDRCRPWCRGAARGSRSAPC